MERELVEMFESVKKAADAAAVDGGANEEDRCVDALNQLKKFPVNYKVLVSTQVGKRLRHLTKHPRKKIQALASNLVEIWKNIIVEETMKNKKNGTLEKQNSIKAEPASPETSLTKKVTTVKVETVKVEKHDRVGTPKSEKIIKTETFDRVGTPKSEKIIKTETFSSQIKIENIDVKTEKIETVKVEKHDRVVTPKSEKIIKTEPFSSQIKIENIDVKTEKIKVAKAACDVKKPTSVSIAPPKLNSIIYCKDATRDKIRELLSEALQKVATEAEEEIRDEVNSCDPFRVAVSVESSMFEKWGRSNGVHKFKYRSVMFNIKDPQNPDFRRKVLLGHIEPNKVVELTPDEMASNERQMQNGKIKEKALFDCERGGPPKATTDQFRCGRCGKRQCTYYQLQTRSADEPMTTFVTCVNCNNHWKFC